MKFTCTRSVLLKEIAIAQEIIASKNAVSILSNIFLAAEDGMLSIKATDLKVNFETVVPVIVEEPGSTTVFGDKFLGILNAIPDGDLEFEQIDAKIIIKPIDHDKKIKFQLKTIVSEDFPQFPVPDNNTFFEAPVRELKEMITQTIFSVSDDEHRYYMTGVFFGKEEEKLIMVATDGRRLAFISKLVGTEIPDFTGVIIPPKILSVITKRAGDEGLIAFSVTEKNIYIRFGSYKLSSILIEGIFPNYKRVIPEEQTYTATIKRMNILDAIKLVSLLIEQKSPKIYLKLIPGSMSIDTTENDFGDAHEEIACQYDGPEVSIALNHRYMEEPFKVMNTNDACIQFTEINKAVTVRPEPENTFFHVIMPMQG
jgi:DNA polymerase-3 subunit beta